jgi:hypothetical protein
MLEIASAGLVLLGIYLLIRRIWAAIERRSELITALSTSKAEQGTPTSEKTGASEAAPVSGDRRNRK